MNELLKIQKVSKVLRAVLTVILVLLPVVSFVCWINFNNIPPHIDMLNLRALPFVTPQSLSLHSRLLCFAASLIPLCVEMAGIVILIRLFRLYERMSIFNATNVACFRKLGKILLAQALAGVLYIPLLSLAITMDNPPGTRRIAIGIDSLDMTALVAGTMIIVISWVMEEGRKLEDEQLHTV